MAACAAEERVEGVCRLPAEAGGPGLGGLNCVSGGERGVAIGDSAFAARVEPAMPSSSAAVAAAADVVAGGQIGLAAAREGRRAPGDGARLSEHDTGAAAMPTCPHIGQLWP